jgi:hypothetical protein
MARRIKYWIEDDGKNFITDDEWEEIMRLQRWYNSEFVWTAGKINFKRFAVFPNWENIELMMWAGESEPVKNIISKKFEALISSGMNESEALEKLEKEGFVILKRGGYIDNSIASGITRIGGNEFNAYLLCEFLLKASLIATGAEMTIYDEGEFIKSGLVKIKAGIVYVPKTEKVSDEKWGEMRRHKKVFSIVDPAKYTNYPRLKNVIPNYNSLNRKDKLAILHDWNWLGYGDPYDFEGDDLTGYDLNKKAKGIVFLKENQP